jgi:hypothetical protein
MWASGMGGRQLATLIALYLRAKDARSALVVPLTPRPETMVPGTVDGAPPTFFGQTFAGAGALTVGAAAAGLGATAAGFGAGAAAFATGTAAFAAGAAAFGAVTDAVFAVARTIALVPLPARRPLTTGTELPPLSTARAMDGALECELDALDAAASDAADVVVVDTGAVIALKMPAADAAVAELSTTDDERLTLPLDA